ncbi:hypothetical protein ONZ43_g5493 [Nemania bipapillata]|uniref:Uncharacterized protein n=1 Tax=Nemania bipapillata TaxID=110536 RepID=A0ACC2I9X2_9PEZI|nr:hypothetical protein ONZ43_g5493 [Nemania bipapillata]
MAIAGELDIDEVMADDELVSGSEGVTFVLSDDEKEEEYTSLQPKVPFKQRVNPFVGPKDDDFLRIEKYFFALLRSPGLTIEGILEGTFDAHEISLITPQSGPLDVVSWQRRNARRYYENLETRFKGHPDTLAFKMACLYFGLPVEPLRKGTMPFDLPLDLDRLDTAKDAPPVDSLGFLRKYEYEEEFAEDKSILSLRGGGGRGFVATRRREAATNVRSAVQEVSPEGYEMDFTWSNSPATNTNTSTRNRKTILPSQEIQLYGWQGAVNTSLRYSEFVTQVDRLISNWNRVDQSISVEVWRRSPVKLAESVTATIYHNRPDAPAGDPIWNVIQKYFHPESADKYACFIRRGDEDDSMDEDRPRGYEPSSSDRYIVRIENESSKGEVTYMRVPDRLHAHHKAHQFSGEYTLAMQALLLPEAPHAWVSYQHGLAGDAYQYMDPPSGIWDQVIEAQKDWEPLPSIAFSLKDIGSQVVPVIVPGVFKPGQPPHMQRRDFRFANSARDSAGLGKLYGAIESCMGNLNLRDCSGFELWCSGLAFKQTTQPPTLIQFSGSITSPASLKDWRAFLAAGIVPDEPFSLVVRPVYKTYRLRNLVTRDKTEAQINELDVAQFKALVHKRLDRSYDPNDASHVVVLEPTSQASYQPLFSVRHDTTEAEWQWILRNVIESSMAISVADSDNEWSKSNRQPSSSSPFLLT